MLDIIGNVEKPYALVKPLVEEQPKGLLYLEVPKAGRRKRRE